MTNPAHQKTAFPTRQHHHRRFRCRRHPLRRPRRLRCRHHRRLHRGCRNRACCRHPWHRGSSSRQSPRTVDGEGSCSTLPQQDGCRGHERRRFAASLARRTGDRPGLQRDNRRTGARPGLQRDNLDYTERVHRPPKAANTDAVARVQRHPLGRAGAAKGSSRAARRSRGEPRRSRGRLLLRW